MDGVAAVNAVNHRCAVLMTNDVMANLNSEAPRKAAKRNAPSNMSAAKHHSIMSMTNYHNSLRRRPLHKHHNGINR